jgi:hypothetical protein
MDGTVAKRAAAGLPQESELRGKIKSIGFLPFVLAHGHGSFFVCPTQNEADQFCRELASQPWFDHSRLLRGVVRALSGKPDEGAELLLAWLEGGEAGRREAVAVLEPDGVLVHAQYNYPTFTFDWEGACSDVEQRRSMLRAAFSAHMQADGNNALRYAIIEAMALALGRALVSQGQYPDALAIVDSATSVNPRSPHLKAMRDALLDGIEPGLVEHRPTTAQGEEHQADTPADAEQVSIRDEVAGGESNFIYIAAMMKAGSTLMWLIASALQEPSGRAAPEKMEGVPHNEFLPLNRETLKWFPRGGVYKNHAPVSYHTDRFQKETGSKCIILLRHPADHVAGFYCHQRGIVSVLRREDVGIPKSRLTPWWLAAGPTRIDQFDPKVPVNQAIDHLISDGYLFKVLEWIAEWVRFRNPALSIVVTYEQLINDYDGTMVRLSQFIRGERPSEDVLNYLRHVNKSVADEGREKGRLDKYPFGWTGRIGTWQQYFSFENACRYNEVVGKFLACHPFASGLLDIYPSPFLDASAIQA